MLIMEHYTGTHLKSFAVSEKTIIVSDHRLFLPFKYSMYSDYVFLYDHKKEWWKPMKNRFGDSHIPDTDDNAYCFGPIKNFLEKFGFEFSEQIEENELYEIINFDFNIVKSIGEIQRGLI